MGDGCTTYIVGKQKVTMMKLIGMGENYAI